MTIALPRLHTSTDQAGGLRFVRVARFALPLCLFVLASSFEVGEHLLKGERLVIDFMGQAESLFFGCAGALAVFLTLTYVLRLMEELERTRNRTVR